MEIVSEPDIRSPEEAGLYMRKLRSILRYLAPATAIWKRAPCAAMPMSRCARSGEEGYRTRCEIKNLNSIRFIIRAIKHEAKRQVEVFEGGGEVVQETRLYDSDKGETRSMRGKEEAHDYRYFPDPDLLPIVLSDELVARLKAELPELPDEKRNRFEADYGLSAYDAGVLVAERATAAFFEEAAAKADPKQAANWIVNDLFGQLGRVGKGIEESPISVANLAELLGLIADKTISGRIAKDVFAIMFETGDAPKKNCRREGAGAGHRHIGDRAALRCGNRRQSQAGGKLPQKSQGGRLVCRPGDESQWRQGQSANGQGNS